MKALKRSEMMPKTRLAGPLIIGVACLLFALGCGKGPEQKVFVLGIDGLTFDLLIPWAREGKLPNFARLLAEGSSTQLVSAVPPYSPPAWTSAVTGVNPGKHGIFGFVKGIDTSGKEPQLRFYTAMDRQADPLWVILSEYGRRSIVINVPCSSPPDKLKGVMISGFPHTSLTNFTYPPEYRFKISGYRKDIYGQDAAVEGDDAFLEDLNDITNRRVDLILKLMQEERWDLFFAVFTITDRVQHYFWKHMDAKHPNWEPGESQQYRNAILNAYQRMDSILGQIQAGLDDRTTLLVLSDHGFGPIYRPVNGDNFIDQHVHGQDLQKGTFRIMAADQFGAAYHLVTEKRPPYDQATQNDYIQTKNLLKRKLEELKDPLTGKQVIRQVFDRRELYQGPHINMAPDLMALEMPGYLFWNWNPRKDKGVFLQKGDPVFDHFLSGFHTMNGVLIMAGKNIRKGIINFQAQIIDITPTVLYLLGEPIPGEMDGTILGEPIAQEYVQLHPQDARRVRTSQSPTTEALFDSTEAVDEFIEEQLRAIGYVQ
jgi:predicted AlkP superfamily phosphohydrolase/phosphomutase